MPDLNRASDISDEQWRNMARDRYHVEGEIEVDDDAIVSDSDEGAYVQAWVWVDRPDPAEADWVVEVKWAGSGSSRS